MQGQDPSERQADDAAAFADAGGFEMVADFAAHQIGIAGQGREGHGGGDGLADLQGTAAAPHDDGFEPVAVNGNTQDGGGALFFRRFHYFKVSCQINWS